MGRQSLFTDEMKEKIKEAFSLGLNKTEVALKVGISRVTLNKYIESHKRFGEECEQMRSNVKMHAKLNIAKAIIEDGNLSASERYVERHGDDDEMGLTDNGITFIDDIPISEKEERFA